MTVVQELSELKFVPTEVKYFIGGDYDEGGKLREHARIEDHAVLYEGLPKSATVAHNNIYLGTYMMVHWYTKIYVGPHAQHKRLMQMAYDDPPPKGRRKRSRGSYRLIDEVPNLMLIAWGDWSLVELPFLPDSAETIQRKAWAAAHGYTSVSSSPDHIDLREDVPHLVNYWREVQRRFIEATGGSLWFDTVEAALRKKYPQEVAHVSA